MPTAAISDLSCSAKAEHPVIADARFSLTRRWLLDRPPSRTMTAESHYLVSSLSHAARIVGAFARDGHVVHVAFAQAGARDAHELGLAVQLGKRARPHIAHGGAQAAAELMQHGRGRALVGHLAFDAFRHELE